MPMQIVPLADRKDLIAELAALHQAEWGHFEAAISLEERIVALDKAAGRKGVPSIFIAIANNQLIGSAALVEQDLDVRPELSPWLAAVYVKKSFRQQGIATQLIARCERELVRVNANYWYLYTEFASKLYEKIGWQHVEQIAYKGTRVYLMRKPVVSA